MTEFTIISQDEFEFKKNGSKNTIVIENGIDDKIFYQLILNEVIVLVSGIEAYRPKIREVAGYYVISYIDCCYFYSLNKLDLIKKIDSLVYVYDVFQFEKTIVLISEIDIYCYSTELVEIKHIMTDDIVANYQIKKGVLLIELANGEKIEINL